MAFTRIIDSFKDEYRWLSNFWVYDNNTQMTVEYHYQAAKATNVDDYALIISADNAYEAKRLGSSIVCRADWYDVRLALMEHFVKEKFIWNGMLASKLKATSDALLVEGNTWNDTFWGVCNGVGENHLGKILMKIRDEFL